MAVTIDNPFIITGYESPTYFCDRKSETAQLIDALHNGRNVTLTSPRRMGKTGLILHAFHLLKEQHPDRRTIYIDLFATESIADFTRVFSTAVLGRLDSNPVRMMKKAAAIVKGARPTIYLDEVTGSPKISLDFVKGEEEHTIEQVFNYLKESGKECYIAFDEFQQVATYPEKNVEALLRSHIQHIHNAHFIFSGSQAHMLNEMFLSPKRPFYQSSSHMAIGPIEENAYFIFASAFFSKKKTELDKDSFHHVYQRYNGHTWYIQKILNELYARKEDRLDEELIQQTIRHIIEENEYYYQMLVRAYSKGQVKLIKAIAKEKVVKEITSGSFITKYGLTATSSVKSALKRLLDEEVVYLSEEGYSIYDRFFGEWLAEK